MLLVRAVSRPDMPSRIGSDGGCALCNIARPFAARIGVSAIGALEFAGISRLDGVRDRR